MARRARYLTEFLRDALFCLFPLPWFSSSALSIPYNGAILGAARVPPFRVRAALQKWVPLWCSAKTLATAPCVARGTFSSRFAKRHTYSFGGASRRKKRGVASGKMPCLFLFFTFTPSPSTRRAFGGRRGRGRQHSVLSVVNAESARRDFHVFRAFHVLHTRPREAAREARECFRYKGPGCCARWLPSLPRFVSARPCDEGRAKYTKTPVFVPSLHLS